MSRFPSVALASLLLVAAACSSGTTARPEQNARIQHRTLNVPDDFKTVQAAANAAHPGDVISLAPGVYRESVLVATDNITVRGANRNGARLDGGYRLSDGIRVTASHVHIENLTVARFLRNGVLFDGTLAPRARPLTGWRARYVTAHNNGSYGIYALAASGGVMDHVYASGHGDAGLYIGRCSPCDALVTHSTAEANTIGFEGTNVARVSVVHSTFRRNRIGLTINSQLAEPLPPSRMNTVTRNTISDNNNPATPPSQGAFGFGVALGGTLETLVSRNRIVSHSNIGILVTSLDGFQPDTTVVADNTLRLNALDLGFFSLGGGTLIQRRNCFARNRYRASFPVRIEARLACGASSGLVTGAPKFGKQPKGISYRAVPPPPLQPEMPSASP